MPPKTEKRVTIYDVAKALNISTATVHRALSGKETIHEKTRERVLEMVDRLGYRPNRLARSLSSKNVRLAVVAFTSFPEFHDQIIAGAKQATQDLVDFNLHTDFYSYSGGDSNTAAVTAGGNCHGLICVPHPVEQLRSDPACDMTMIADRQLAR